MGFASPKNRATVQAPLNKRDINDFGMAPASQDASTHSKLCLEVPNYVRLVCTFAGGPHGASALAMTCRNSYTAVSRTWEDLTRLFPTRLYVVGGLNSMFREVDTAWRLDPAVGLWEQLPPVGQVAAGSGSVAAAGILYILGGELSGVALQEVFCFDPLVGTWQQAPSMLQGRIRPAVAYSGGFIYVMGGLNGSKALNSVERYDPKTRIWQEMPAMHRPRYAAAAAARPGGCVLAFAGELTDAGVAASLECYDPKSNTWELLPAVKTPTCGAALALTGAGSTAFSIGGLGLSGQALPVAEQLVLAPSLGGAAVQAGFGKVTAHLFQPPLWNTAPPMATPRHLASAAAFNHGAVAVGGKGPTFEAVSSVEAFNPEEGCWKVLPPLPSPRLRAAVVCGRF